MEYPFPAPRQMGFMPLTAGNTGREAEQAGVTQSVTQHRLLTRGVTVGLCRVAPSVWPGHLGNEQERNKELAETWAHAKGPHL